jgi:hypothetical protein
MFSPNKLRAVEEYRKIKQSLTPVTELNDTVSNQLDKRNPNYKKRSPWKIEKTNELFNPEDVPKSLPYQSGNQATLGDLRDKIRLNSIKHMEYQPELDPIPMRVKHGEIVYDPNYNIYDPAVENLDLITTLKPFAEEKEAKLLTAVKDRVKATFMDIYG